MDRQSDQDNAVFVFNHFDGDEGYYSKSESESTITPPPAVPTNTPINTPATPPEETLEESPEVPLDNLPADDLFDGQPAAPRKEPPSQPRARLAKSWPGTLAMAVLVAGLLVLPMAVSRRAPEAAFHLVVIHLVWLAYATYGLLSTRWPRAALWISVTLAHGAFVLILDGPRVQFPQPRMHALLVSAGTLLLLMDREVVAAIREARRGTGGAGGGEG